MSFRLFWHISFIALIACNCSRYYHNRIIEPVLNMDDVSEIQKEVDDIFILLTYSLVFRDWQAGSVPRQERRGYNIGALLVNAQNEPVYYGLNCINSTDNATQHGEVRAITQYLEKARSFNLSGHTLYTTLEPCVMCAGMITMTAVKRVVFGQNDVEYSKAFERLAIDTRPIGGFPPYPRRVIAQASSISFREELDEAYNNFLESNDEKILAIFLVSDEARSIFEKALNSFKNYEVEFEENRNIYESALQFFNEN
ncbi:MAG: nucleoside deaminase [Phaeodactylibacter sp.]|nr:nucleoside deaminase [Phaeodactylibacter sp.]